MVDFIADAGEISYIGLAISVFLPWLLGTVTMCFITGRHPRHITLLLGHGYLLGLIITSLVFRGFSATNTPLQFWPIAACLTALTACMSYLLARFRPLKIQWRASFPTDQRRELPTWAVLAALFLCALIGFRFYLITQEVLLRPLFPWDAWDSWAPRTIQFYDNRELYAELHTIKRPHGYFSNIIHLWSMLGANSYQSPLINLPWVLCLAALCFALYGQLLRQGGPLVALVACYILSSMPYINIHTALAGYADLWLTLIFSLGIFSIMSFQQERRIAWGLLTLLYALVCVQTKYAGLGLAAILIACQLYVLIQHERARLIAALMTTGLIAAITYSVANGMLTIMFEIPWLGRLHWNAGELVIGEIRSHKINYVPITGALNEVFLVYSNWHLLSVLMVGTVMTCFIKRCWSALAQPVLLAIALTVLYSYTYHILAASRSALDHTSLSRSLIYITAIAVVWLVSTLVSFSNPPTSIPRTSRPALGP